MIQEGQIVLFRFPQTDQALGRLRPALVLRRLPGPHDDWLVCMLSSQLSQAIAGFDETIDEEDAEFEQSGLKTPSVIRISRLAVADKDILLGSIGSISADRLSRTRHRLSTWIEGT